MGVRKYIKDYKVEYIVKPNGKPGIKAVYVGKYYGYVAKGKVLKHAKLLLAVLCFIGVTFGILPFVYRSESVHTLYVAVPHAVALFPIVYTLIGVFNLFYCCPPLIAEFRAKIVDRLARAPIASAVLLGAVSVAQAVNLVLNFDKLSLIADGGYLVCTAVSAAAFFLMHLRRGSIAVEETVPPDGEEDI